MVNKYQHARDIINLFEYVEGLGQDRPKVSEFLKELGIKPETMWDAVKSTSFLSHQTNDPQLACDATNELFKIGITIGYKYAIKKEMEKSFGSLEEPNKKED